MYIKELNLINFGKFNNKKISFNKGFNLIEGLNEAGKSTIHKFIEGVFFGFVKPYLKTTKFTEDYYKYKPWNSEDYNGSILLNYSGVDYRIVRDFKNKEYKIYDEITGKDITETLNGYEKSNLSFPGEYFFKMSSDIFKSTFFIEQNELNISDNFKNQLSGHMSNLIENNTQNLSILDSLEYLNKIKNKIGTEKAKKKPYGKLLQEKEDLEKNIYNYENSKEKYNETVVSLENEKKKFESYQSILENIDKVNKYKEYQRLSKAEDIRKKLINDIQKIDDDIYKYKDIEKIPDEDFLTLRNIDDELNEIQKQFNELSKRKKVVFQEYNNIKKDIEKYDFNIEKQKSILELSKELKKYKKKNLKLLTLDIIAIILTIIIGLRIDLNYIPIPLGVSLFLFIITFIVNRKKKKIDFQLNDNIAKVCKLNDIPLQNVDDLLESSIFKDLNQDKIKYFNDLDYDLETIDSEINILLNDEESKKNEKQDLLFKFKNLSSIKTEDFYRIKNNIDLLKKSKEDKIKMLSTLETNNDFDNLYELEKINFNDINEDNLYSEDEIRNKLNISSESIATYLERVKYLEKDIEKLISCKEELNKVNDKIKLMEENIESINIAIETINYAQNEVHKNYIPRLNSELSDNFRDISDKDYKLFIDDDFNIKFRKEETDDYINISSLSKGSIDQIAILFRISLTRELFENAMIFFDDAFVQFDNIRLEKFLRFLYELSNNHQIIVFTCQNRERKLMEKNKLNINIQEI